MVRQRGMVHIVLLPYLDAEDIFHFAMLNKWCYSLCDPRLPGSVNFKVLFLAQKKVMTPEKEEACKKSLADALIAFAWPVALT
jgi:hypothetical protein